MVKKIITDDYEFANLIRGGAVYVDKTDLLARLASGRDGSQFFIARPRRFGKSLMLSTLHHLFVGDKALFKGLKIMKTRWNWSKTYPVIHLDMQGFKCPDAKTLEAKLNGFVRTLARQQGLKINWKENQTSGPAFTACLKALGEKCGKFVVLVDEYDVPLQGFIGTREVIKVRRILHDFYSAFKANVGSIRFLMMTGVSKFTKLSVFSSLNNLTDLTTKYGRYAALLGYTHAELDAYFGAAIKALGRAQRISSDEARRQILAWYDSYRFSPYSTQRVINPVALGQAFNAGVLSSFWSDTGMPTLILERLEASSKRPDKLDGVTARIEDLDVCDAVELPWLPLLYQAGYLTIKKVAWEVGDGCQLPVARKREALGTKHGALGNCRQPVMTLGIPNREVRQALSSQWWRTLMQMREDDFTALVRVAEKQIAAGDIECLVSETLYQLYAKLPPTWAPKTEQEAKRYFLLFMEMAGAKMQAEVPSARGFADAVIETKKGVWIFEFKFNRSADAAIRQIRERGYAEPYAGERRPVTLVGISFDAKRRNITMPKISEEECRM